MNKTRMMGALAVPVVAALALVGCSGSPSGGSTTASAETLTWWHNTTTGPMVQGWQDIADAFTAANPNITVTQTGYQNEDLQRTLIPNALSSGSAPDVFMVWPGGEVADQVASGYLLPLDDLIPDAIKSLGATVQPWQVDGKTYALPFHFGVEGFWYNKDLFAKAGITSTPTTLDELNAAVTKLKAAGITPIAVGAGDSWPAAHWWYQFALHTCSQDTISSTIADLKNAKFDDPCWTKAGEQLQTFIATQPFQQDFLSTPAQTGAGSSAGLVANGNAAMELMGDWNEGTIGGLTPDGKVPDFLAWFPFPGIPGSTGDPTATLGGGDGFGCSATTPDPQACADLLAFILNTDNQKIYAASGAGIPTNPAAASALTSPRLQQISDAMANSSYVQLWFDTAFGTTVGNAMNAAIITLFAGTGKPADVPAAMAAAAATL